MKKKAAVFMAILPVLLFIIIYVYFAYNPSKGLRGASGASAAEETAGSDTSVTITEVTLPAGLDADVYSSGMHEDATDEAGRPLIKSMQLYMLIPVRHIAQNPELPTGCEITSLTMVLNYLGYNVSKTYMADNYLDRLETFDGSFYDYYIGNPYESASWGCFAPAITRSASRFLADNNSSLKAHNISGAPLQTLFDEISDGNPVIVWSTSKWGTPTTYSSIRLNDNIVFNWPSNEHCVVLTGFNLEKNTVFIADPLSDIVERDLTEFAAAYSAYYRQAVVIK